MKIIGITGGIGTGKSTVLDILREKHEAYIVEADKLAHKLMSSGYSVYREIVGVFGEEILTEEGEIDRTILGRLVFGSPESLDRLNRIVHPAVKEFILQDIRKKEEEKTTPLYVVEAALLIEDGYRAVCDELWYVYTEREERIRRLISGRGGNREKWEQIMKNQSADGFYFANCDVVIDNGKSIEDTINVVKDLLS
ncbi:MAG: dephospho-CoA kinase [Lachnospiraceae bacterium]|nr:dephospho-CoA kinase [Lachnospiraceae bacterium]